MHRAKFLKEETIAVLDKHVSSMLLCGEIVYSLQSTVYSLLMILKDVKRSAMTQQVFEQIVRSDPLVEVVIQQITDAIVTGRLGPGDKLVEVQIGKQLGVSRAPLREAFQRLEQIGLVEKIPNRGTFVSTLTERDVKELHSVRELLEGLAARLLAERCDPQTIASLESILAAMRQAAVDDNQSRMITLDADFHDALIELSDHKLLRELWVVMGLRFRRFFLPL